MERAQQETAAEEAETCTCRKSPWPNLNKFMLLIESSQNSYTFRCLLWNPRRKLLSISKTSNTNLRTHIQITASFNNPWLQKADRAGPYVGGAGHPMGGLQPPKTNSAICWMTARNTRYKSVLNYI